MNLDRLADYCAENNIACGKNEPLSARCTFSIGGPAALFIEPDSGESLRMAVTAANSFGVRVFILGNGSNVLFSDDGFDGAVIHIGKAMSGMRLVDDETIECGSGASLQSLTRFALENGLAGLEFAYGIPGSVGGAVYMNAGAYGGEMKDVLTGTFHVDFAGNKSGFTGDDMALSYRHSAYTDKELIITKALFKLNKGDREAIRAKMDDFMRRRRDKQPLELPSAGSTFRRPEGGYASELIDRCGLKGRRVGGAMVSEKHAGFVVNTGGATCADVLALIEYIQKDVREKTGIELHPEVRVVG